VSGIEAPNEVTTVFEGVTPILPVRNLPSSIDYYVTVLGFKVDWHQPEIMASVSRDRCNIMLCEGDQGNPGTWVWIGVGNIEPLFADYAAKGEMVRNPPTNYPWAYEMQIEDLDQHVLRFGSEPKPDEPFGAWRDMHGGIWVLSPSREWTRIKGD
jgi:hypothetical protein